MTTAALTELMNRTYRRQRHVYDLTRKYYLLGRDQMIDGLDSGTGTVLEIGCGTGRNLIVAAERYPQARFYGIDISTEMLTTAIEAIARAGLSSRVRVAHANAAGFDPAPLFGTPRFDRIFVSYSLSMIPQWHAAIDQAVALLAPRGELHVVDFGGQSRLPALFRRLLRHWLALFHVTPRDELARFLNDRARKAGAALDFARPYRDYTQRAVLRLPG
jgi:S-adenosylmethionine-diacylgycerolhomoserine-N-methlytransferase